MPVEYLGGRRAAYGFGASSQEGSGSGRQVNVGFGSDTKSQTEEDLMKSEAELNRARTKDIQDRSPEKTLELEQKREDANFRRMAERYIDSAELDAMAPHEIQAAIHQIGIRNVIVAGIQTAAAITATKERAEKAPLAGMPVEQDPKSFSLLGYQNERIPKSKVQANVPMSLPQSGPAKPASSMLDPRNTDDVSVPGVPPDFYKTLQSDLDKAYGPDPFPGLGSTAVKLKVAQSMAAQERAVRLQQIGVSAANLTQKFIQQVLDVHNKQGAQSPQQTGPGPTSQPTSQPTTSQPAGPEAPTNEKPSYPLGTQVPGVNTMMAPGFSVEKLVGLYSSLKRKDLKNRGMMQSLAGTYDNILGNTSATIMQAVSEDADYAKATGTTSLQPDPSKLLTSILKKVPALSNPEALSVLVDPVNTLQSDSTYADGYPRATVEVIGNALMDNLQTTAASLAKSKSKQTRAYADSLNVAADKLRENLAVLKGAPNSFINEDASVNMTQFIVDKALQTVAKNGPPRPDQSPFPVGVLSGLAKASYAGDRERAQKTLEKALGKGWSPKGDFWDSIAVDPKDDEFLKEWMEYYIGDTQAPTDIDRYGLDKEATAQDRRKALNGLLGYPTGFFSENGGPLGLRAWSSRANRKFAENQKRLADMSRDLNEKFTLPPVNPASGNKPKGNARGQNEANGRAASQPSAE